MTAEHPGMFRPLRGRPYSLLLLRLLYFSSIHIHLNFALDTENSFSSFLGHSVQGRFFWLGVRLLCVSAVVGLCEFHYLR